VVKSEGITNDLNNYGDNSLTLTKEGQTFAAVQEDRSVNYWLLSRLMM
jgi:hypothetical protein